MKISLVLDPGNSTGWVIRKEDGVIIGGTIGEDHVNVAQLIKHSVEVYGVNNIVYETFHLYPGKANKMLWNSFYPCEVIGVIKCTATMLNLPLVGLSPSVKKFAGTCSDWHQIKLIYHDAKGFDSVAPIHITEHTRDAYRLLKYFEYNYK